MPRRLETGQLITSSAVALLTLLSACSNWSPAPAAKPANILDVAVAWKQTAAEYEDLYYQAYNLAQHQVEHALAQQLPGGQTLAVILDLDDTLLDTRDYWAQLLEEDQDWIDTKPIGREI